MTAPFSLKKIEPLDSVNVLTEWSNLEKYSLSYFNLRCQCPCASCVDELTGKRTLKPETIDQKVRPLEVVPVGRYAIQIAWSDSHQTGIYPFDGLYSICKTMGKLL